MVEIVLNAADCALIAIARSRACANVPSTWRASGSKSESEMEELFENYVFGEVEHVESKLGEEISGKTSNWDRDRIASLDMVLLKMAICELLHFSSIPTKVTINEYLEISKEYSTPKSSIFINGILDKIAKSRFASD